MSARRCIRVLERRRAYLTQRLQREPGHVGAARDREEVGALTLAIRALEGRHAPVGVIDSCLHLDRSKRNLRP